MRRPEATVSCPGKLLLCGEYAVLCGAPAVVAAVNRRAKARLLSRETAADSPVLCAVKQEVLRYGIEARGERWRLPPVSVDTSAFRRKGRKLGLGSSSAAAVASCGAWLQSQGIQIEQERELVARLSHAGHFHAQGGRGSGVDVAACTFGGVLRFCPGAPPTPLPLPRMEFAVVDTGLSASTPALLASVRQLLQHAPDLHTAHMEGLTKVASAFIEALSFQDSEAAIGLADDYGMRMAALGESCGCPIVTPTLRLVAEAARSAGGAAKPSGAGGGDLAVAFFKDREGLEKFLRACKKLSLSPLRLQIGAPGLRQERTSIKASFGIGSEP